MFRWLKKDTKEQDPGSKNGSTAGELFINGNQAAQVVKKLIAQARQEKWSPVLSIKLVCTNCEAAVTLRKDSETEFAFVSADGSYKPGNFEDPLICCKCQGTNFRVIVLQKTLKDGFKEALPELAATDQDPGAGFREDGTGNLIRDRTLRRADGFEALWNSIQYYVDLEDDINTRYTFDMVNGRYLDSTIHGLLHYNYRDQRAITILKEQNGNYWYSVEG
jgi:hypothetical protein